MVSPSCPAHPARWEEHVGGQQCGVTPHPQDHPTLVPSFLQPDVVPPAAPWVRVLLKPPEGCSSAAAGPGTAATTPLEISTAQEHDWGFASLLVSRYLQESRRNPRSGTRSNTGHWNLPGSAWLGFEKAAGSDPEARRNKSLPMTGLYFLAPNVDQQNEELPNRSSGEKPQCNMSNGPEQCLLWFHPYTLALQNALSIRKELTFPETRSLGTNIFLTYGRPKRLSYLYKSMKCLHENVYVQGSHRHFFYKLFYKSLSLFFFLYFVFALQHQVSVLTPTEVTWFSVYKSAVSAISLFLPFLILEVFQQAQVFK